MFNSPGGNMAGPSRLLMIQEVGYRDDPRAARLDQSARPVLYPPAGGATPATPDSAGEVRFHRIDLTMQDAGGAGARGASGRIFQWLPCGEGVDLLAEHKALYLMKKEGVLTKVFSTGEQVFNFRNA